MAEETRSQVHNTTAANPFTHLVDDQVKQVGNFYQELDRLAGENLERAQAAVDEVAKLTKESFAYGAKLAAEWRRMGLEATRKTAETMASVSSQTRL
jgi:hypothetical protein